MAVLTLLTLPVSLTLRPQKSSSKKLSKSPSEKKDNLKKIFSISPVYLTHFGENLNKNQSESNIVIGDNNSSNKTPTESPPDKILQKSNYYINDNYNRSTLQLMSSKFVQMALTMERKISTNEKMVLPTIHKLSETAKRSQVKQQLDRIVLIITNPCFALICATHLAYFWGVITYTMVNVDLAVDKGESMKSSGCNSD